MPNSAPLPRVPVRWFLAAAALGLGLLLWRLLPPRTDDPYFGVNWGGPNVRFASVKLEHGDEARWAQREFDDTAWGDVKLSQLPRNRGIFWLRIWVDVLDRRQSADELRAAPDRLRVPGGRNVVGPVESFSVIANCAQEVFWDGRKIGQSGLPGSSPELEEPGPNDNIFVLPVDDRTPGRHLLAVRMSSYLSHFPSPWFVYTNTFGPYAQLAQYPYKPAMRALALLAAATIVGALFVSAWWVVERRPVFLAFALFCFLVGALAGLIVARATAGLLYSDFYWLLAASGVANLAAGVGLLAFVALHQRVERGVWLVLALAAPPLVLSAWFHHLYFVRGWWQARWFLAAALVLAAYGWIRRRAGAGGLMLATGGTWFLLEFSERSLPGNLGDSVMVFGIVGMAAVLFRDLGLQVRAEQLKARQSQLASARLEIELLKKNIQPHFLLNSLASVVELVEQQPADAAKLIHALADEFRILARVSAQRLIPLSQEIELCESHLRVMSLRRETTYRLRTELFEPAAAVPPALIHTLVENAITHGGPTVGERVFRLVQTRGTDGRERYEFFSPLAESPAPRASEGTGTRYVHARLEESFPGRWRHEAGAERGEWRVLIEILPVSPAAVAEASP